MPPQLRKRAGSMPELVAREEGRDGTIFGDDWNNEPLTRGNDQRNAPQAHDSTSDERLTRTLVAALKDAGLVGVHSQTPAEPKIISAPVPILERAVAWAGMPRYPGRSDTVDLWFQCFEARMHTARIPMAKWIEKLLECPGLRPETKQRIFGVGLVPGDFRDDDHQAVPVAQIYGASPAPSITPWPASTSALRSSVRGELEDIRDAKGNELTGYQLIRRFLLLKDGPIYPTGYFMDRIHSVQGNAQEDVSEALEKWFCLYNRAAQDEGHPPLVRQQLMYPFIRAFPLETQEILRRELRSAMRSGDPLQYLGDKAPTRPGEPSQPALIAAMEPVRAGNSVGFRGNKRAHPYPSGRMQPSQGRPLQRQARCRGCGRDCITRSRCPAFGQTCSKCGRQNHYARVCLQSATSVSGANCVYWQSPSSPRILAPRTTQMPQNSFLQGPAAPSLPQ